MTEKKTSLKPVIVLVLGILFSLNQITNGICGFVNGGPLIYIVSTSTQLICMAAAMICAVNRKKIPAVVLTCVALVLCLVNQYVLTFGEVDPLHRLCGLFRLRDLEVPHGQGSDVPDSLSCLLSRRLQPGQVVRTENRAAKPAGLSLPALLSAQTAFAPLPGCVTHPDSGVSLAPAQTGPRPGLPSGGSVRRRDPWPETTPGSRRARRRRGCGSGRGEGERHIRKAFCSRGK